MCCRPMVKEAFTSYVVLPVGFIRCGDLKCAAVCCCQNKKCAYFLKQAHPNLTLNLNYEKLYIRGNLV